MNTADSIRNIVGVTAAGPHSLQLTWSDCTEANIDVGFVLEDPLFAALRDPANFVKVELGDWGHSIEWPGGEELGAEMLWLETLSVGGHKDARLFLEWRLRHGLSLSKAAEALGISRRMVAYYSNGEKGAHFPHGKFSDKISFQRLRHSPKP